MNTPLSNHDIAARLRGVRGFRGVTSYDRLIPLKNHQFCITNTDNVVPVFDEPEGGHHWITVCRVNKRLVFICDSFGRTLAEMEEQYTEPGLTGYFRQAYPDCRFVTNPKVFQHESTAVCGWYAILFGKLFARWGMRTAQRIFNSLFNETDRMGNDENVLRMFTSQKGGGDDDDDGGDADSLWKDKVNEVLQRLKENPPLATLKSRQRRLAGELHRSRRLHFPRRQVKSKAPDHIWSADLVDMQAFAKQNSNYKYLLTVIELYTRYAWAVPLKTKTGSEVVKAFQNIIEENENQGPQKLWTDQGTEFYNASMKRFLASRGIILYSTRNEGKAVVVERFNRTLKSKMWRFFTEHNTRRWVDRLDRLIDSYNSTRHRVIGRPPLYVYKLGFRIRPPRRPQHPPKIPKPSLKVSDEVRLSVSKNVFDKGFTPNWTDEVFIITRVHHTQPVTYEVKDLTDEPVQGKFYKEELQRSYETGLRFDRVLRTQRGKKLIRWKGYWNKKFDTWITPQQVKKLRDEMKSIEKA